MDGAVIEQQEDLGHSVDGDRSTERSDSADHSLVDGEHHSADEDLPEAPDGDDDANPERRRYHRHTAAQRRRKIQRAVWQRWGPRATGTPRPTWDAIAAALAIDRRTLTRWRQSPAWDEAEAACRRVMAAEIRALRADPTRLRAEMFAHLTELALGARSAYVQLAAVREVLRELQPEREEEDAEVDGAAAWIAFAQEQRSRRG